MSEICVGGGQPCDLCGMDYGEHDIECKFGQAVREAEARKAITRDCDHDWQPSGFCLVTTGQLALLPHIETLACTKCRLLRMPS